MELTAGNSLHEDKVSLLYCQKSYQPVQFPFLWTSNRLALSKRPIIKYKKIDSLNLFYTNLPILLTRLVIPI